MKTAIYQEDGTLQVVLTPESDWERTALAVFNPRDEDRAIAVEIFHGSFYDCRGGWVRQNSYYPRSHETGPGKDDSLILRAVKRLGKTEPKASQSP